MCLTRYILLSALLTCLVSTANAESLPNKIAGKRTTYDIVKAGEGPAITKGARVTVHATGIVKQTGKKFWSTKDTNQPFKYKAGVGSVITGWDQGCMGMQLGEIRKLDIPADEGYGARGFPQWGIPPGGGLDFEIEVLEIEQVSEL
mmetsp:Transcript_29896/g.65341  ORF Transcript_29896/g.65341 Transcript_29896/m.65341 type:complete len:146 (-) Transcript_29896:1324-1761(-)